MQRLLIHTIISLHQYMRPGLLWTHELFSRHSDVRFILWWEHAIFYLDWTLIRRYALIVHLSHLELALLKLSHQTLLTQAIIVIMLNALFLTLLR